MATKNKEDNMSKVTNLSEKREEKESQNYNLIPYQIDDSNFVNVKQSEDTIWLSQKQIAKLFDCSTENVITHLKNIFEEGELDKKVVTKFYLVTTQHGAIKGKTQTSMVKHYNLDAIISVGYRVNSKRGTMFRQWATKILKEHITKPYKEKIEQIQKNINEPVSNLKLTKNETRKIQNLLRKKGITQNQIASDLGFTYVTISNVINGKTYNAFIISYLKDILGLNKEEENNLFNKSKYYLKGTLNGDCKSFKKLTDLLNSVANIYDFESQAANN